VDGVTTSDRSLRIARGISRMAIDLGVNVVAEGIESPDQTAVLLELGITLGQGFHYARPMNALSLLAYLGQPRQVGSISGEDLQSKAV
jgi:EAL domain-containing protein (putative c-di-GMP-specific phosphodiesterase class I)